MIMKTLQTLTLVLAICFGATTHAQFLKKIKKRAAEAAESTMERKVEEKAAKETEKVFDSTFNNQGKLFKKEVAKPAEYYSFSHKYVMQLDDGKKPATINYFLTDEGSYIGSGMDLEENEEIITVIDLPTETAHMFMNMGEQKSTMSFGLNFEQVTENAAEATDVSITPTENSKMILGYNCYEYQVEGKNFHGSVWVTDEADVSFGSSFYQMKNKKFKALKSMDQSWMATLDGLTMETTITDTSRKKPSTITMTCMALDAIEYVIDTNEYNKTF
jgi:cbb3-type cytochrome oxidase subunit 3